MTRHLLDRFDMKHIKVDSTELGDQYDPEANAVRLTPDNFSGKSLTAVTMAAREVGHVLQDHGGGLSALVERTRLLRVAQGAAMIGIVTLPHSSWTLTPAWASFNTAMICSSACRFQVIPMVRRPHRI